MRLVDRHHAGDTGNRTEMLADLADSGAQRRDALRRHQENDAGIWGLAGGAPDFLERE